MGAPVLLSSGAALPSVVTTAPVLLFEGRAFGAVLPDPAGI